MMDIVTETTGSVIAARQTEMLRSLADLRGTSARVSVAINSIFELFLKNTKDLVFTNLYVYSRVSRLQTLYGSIFVRMTLVWHLRALQ